MNLKREVGLLGAMMMGLGSIIGTGVFVSIGLGTNLAGQGVLLAIFLASIVAICNGLSSAQLAANHPVSGGTYEYGHRWLNPQVGFIAGWMFLSAKSASAAAAALGLSSYVLQAFRIDPLGIYQVAVALAILLCLSCLTLLGIRRTSIANSVIVTVTLGSLTFFIVAGILADAVPFTDLYPIVPTDPGSLRELLQATALMFVAYTGYGRIATLGEEIRNPGQNIPRAIIMTLAVSMVVYLGVAWVILKMGTGHIAGGLASSIEVVSLEAIAAEFNIPGAGQVLLIGAVTAMLGVLLNLLLGLSRVMLAMGRRGEMPAATAVSDSKGTPVVATLAVTAIIGAITAIGSVKLVWSFSAFTVLIYYSITNLCALRMKKEERLYSILPAWVGLIACLFLAFWVEIEIWCVGLGLILLGLMWQRIILPRSFD